MKNLTLIAIFASALITGCATAPATPVAETPGTTTAPAGTNLFNTGGAIVGAMNSALKDDTASTSDMVKKAMLGGINGGFGLNPDGTPMTPNTTTGTTTP